MPTMGLPFGHDLEFDRSAYTDTKRRPCGRWHRIAPRGCDSLPHPYNQKIWLLKRERMRRMIYWSRDDGGRVSSKRAPEKMRLATVFVSK